MKIGKLSPEFLSELLKKFTPKDDRVVLGAKLGEDAALIDFGDTYLVATSDPITFSSDYIGWYVVQINANDIAAMGAIPRWFIATLLLPEDSTESIINNLFNQLAEACDALNISLIGGHTEITHGINRPIVSGTMLGLVEKRKVVFTSGARPGDSIILTKQIAIEGTSIIAREFGSKLLDTGIDPKVISKARNLLFDPGISVVEEAILACESVKVHSMHDPTEGGIATGLSELATAAGIGLLINREEIPILTECKQFCDLLGIDPLGMLSSGSLLITVDYEDGRKLIDVFKHNGISASEIGTCTATSEGLKLITDGCSSPLPIFEKDELARYISSM